MAIFKCAITIAVTTYFCGFSWNRDLFKPTAVKASMWDNLYVIWKSQLPQTTAAAERLFSDLPQLRALCETNILQVLASPKCSISHSMHTSRNHHLYEVGLIECVCPNLPELRIVCELHDMQVRALLKCAVSDILLLVCVVRAAFDLPHTRRHVHGLHAPVAEASFSDDFCSFCNSGAFQLLVSDYRCFAAPVHREAGHHDAVRLVCLFFRFLLFSAFCIVCLVHKRICDAVPRPNRH